MLKKILHPNMIIKKQTGINFKVYLLFKILKKKITNEKTDDKLTSFKDILLQAADLAIPRKKGDPCCQAQRKYMVE